MPATQSLPSPSPAMPRLYSAADLCRAMAAGGPGRFDTTTLDRTLRHDADRGQLEVQAGVPWQALIPFTGAGFLTGAVGNSVEANAAGADGRPVVAHLRALTLVTADGELRRASPERTPELFRLAVGGFGAFGPFYSVTLDLASLACAAAQARTPARLELPPVGTPGQALCVELLVPPPSSEAFIAQVRSALEERRCMLTQLEVRHTLAEHTTHLRWARREYAAVRLEFRVRPTLGASVAGVQLRRHLFDLCLAAGGTIAPSQLPYATREQAAAGYPMLGSFLAEKLRFDPAERVRGAWYRAVRALWRRESCAVRWSRS